MRRVILVLLLCLTLTGSAIAQGARGREGVLRVASCTGKLGDINGDGRVDILDFSILATSYGQAPGEEGWDGRADLNRDGVVNDLDFAHFKLEYGR